VSALGHRPTSTEKERPVARVEFPAWWVSTGAGVPEVCARHGEPAVKRVDTAMWSRPRWWAYLLPLGGPLLSALAGPSSRKAVSGSGWSLCARCRIRQVITLCVGPAVIGAGAATVVVSLSNADSTADSNLWLWGLFAGLAVALAGEFVALHARAQGTAGAVVSRDGEAVVVRRPNERFAARAAELAAAERESIPARSLFPYEASRPGRPASVTAPARPLPRCCTPHAAGSGHRRGATRRPG
jgi:hypothetical protein